jgi:hypothetical protein
MTDKATVGPSPRRKEGDQTVGNGGDVARCTNAGVLEVEAGASTAPAATQRAADGAASE